MADNITERSRSYSTDADNPGRQIDEDPLVELARIVSEDGSFFQNAPAKPPNPPESKAGPDAFSADLEAELMEEFEASLAGEAAGVAGIAHADEPAAAAPGQSEGGPADYTASDSQALGAMAAAAEMPAEEPASTAHGASAGYAAGATEEGDAPFGAPARGARDLPGNAPYEPGGNLMGSSTVEPAVEPTRHDYGATGDAVDVTGAGATPSDAFGMEFAESLTDTVSPPLEEDFTPEFGVEAYGRDPDLHDSDIPGDGPLADEAGYPPSHYGGAAADEMDDAYEGEAAMPPPVPARTGGRKGLIAVAGVLAVVVLGAGIAGYIGKSAPNDPATPAPVIKADADDIKVMADAADSNGSAPSALERLTDQQAKSEEKLIDRIEEPQEIARVVLPGAASNNVTQLTKPVGAPAEEPSEPATDVIAKTIDRVMQAPDRPVATPRYDPIGPRKVRTVVVNPDGTIVPNDSAPAPARPSLPAAAPPAAPPASETMEVASVDSVPAPQPTPVPTVEIKSLPSPGETTAVTGSGDATETAEPDRQAVQMAAVEPASPVAGTGDAVNGDIAPHALAEPVGVVPRPKPASPPDAVTARRSAAPARASVARSTSEPVNLLAAPAETDQPRVTASTASTAGGYVVQVSSQRSAEQAQASFAAMQRRYRSVLGGFEPNIQRADLGDKGTYFRVRIGPMASRDAALRLCEQLKAAGGSCFVTR